MHWNMCITSTVENGIIHACTQANLPNVKFTWTFLHEFHTLCTFYGKIFMKFTCDDFVCVFVLCKNREKKKHVGNDLKITLSIETEMHTSRT